MKTLLAILSVALLVGCANTVDRVPPDAAARLKKIGVVSVAANSFSRQYVGVTVFGNELEHKDIKEWGLNAIYEERLASAVEKAFGATAVRSSQPAADFSRLHDLNGPWPALAFFTPNWGAIEGATRTYCAATGVDAVLVAGRVKTGDVFGRTNQVVEGLGIYTRRSDYLLHLLAVVGLMDCKTAKPLATVQKISTRPLSQDIARLKFAEWTPEVEQQLRQSATTLGDAAWVEAVDQIAPAR